MQKFKKIQEQEQWRLTYNVVKQNSNYNFINNQVESYLKKYHDYVTNLEEPDHRNVLDELQTNLLRLVNDINLIDLPELATCIEAVFDKLFECQRLNIKTIEKFKKSIMKNEESLRSYLLTGHRCIDCKKNIYQSYIENLMNRMTLTKQAPNVSEQIHQINLQLEEISFGNEHNELRLMIDQVLRNKDLILNQKHRKINIYDQISQYLENISQSTINMSKDEIKSVPLELVSVANFSQRIQDDINLMLQKPIKKLIQKVLEHAQKIYRKEKKVVSTSMQTKSITNDEALMKLMKENDHLHKELSNIKKLKRQTDADVVKMIENQQRQEIKIFQLTNKCNILQRKNQQLSEEQQLATTKLDESQLSKKDLGDKIIHEYLNEKSLMMKIIKQLEIKIMNSDREIKILRRQNNQFMVSKPIQVNITCLMENSSTQTDLNSEEGGYAYLKKSKKITRKGTKTPTISEVNPDEIIESQLEENGEKIREAIEDHFRISICQDLKICEEKIKQNSQRQKKETLLDLLEQKESLIESKSSAKKSRRILNHHTQRQASQQFSKIFCREQKNERKIISSRMFIPQTNTSPYASPYKGLNFTANYFENLERNSVKTPESLENSEIRQKYLFMKKIDKGYERLKNIGFKKKIEEELDENYDSKGKMQKISSNQNLNLKENSVPVQSHVFTKIKKPIQKKKQNSKAFKREIIPKKTYKKVNQIQNFSKEWFSLDEGILLFDSVQNMKAYEQKSGIWAFLESSLVVDNNFMSVCDKIQVFFLQLKKQNPSQYTQCHNFLISPIKYFDLQNEKKALVKTADFKKTEKHFRNFSYFPLSSNNVKKYEIRQIFHLLFRYHNMWHRKCTHVEEFLLKMGFQERKN